MRQLVIPGTLFNIYPTTKAECEDLLEDVYCFVAKSTVPDEYIRAAVPAASMRSYVKRLREKMISDGYRLMCHLDNAVVDPRVMRQLLWKEDVVLMWNHFILSLQRLHDYLKDNAVKYEEA